MKMRHDQLSHSVNLPMQLKAADLDGDNNLARVVGYFSKTSDV